MQNSKFLDYSEVSCLCLVGLTNKNKTNQINSGDSILTHSSDLWLILRKTKALLLLTVKYYCLCPGVYETRRLGPIREQITAYSSLLYSYQASLVLS